MKATIVLFSFVGIFITTAAIGQQQKPVHQDPFPDVAVINALENLPSANAADTSLGRLSVLANGTAIHLSSFKTGRHLVSSHGFAGKKAQEIAKVISLTPSQKRVLDFVQLMQAKANYLQHLNFSDNLTPSQTRIAYSWGSKEYEGRAKPPGDGDHCTYKVHGLDCSGFIYQLLAQNGISIPGDDAYADEERKPEFLKKYLKKYFFKDLPFDVVDKKKLHVKDMQLGDIVYFMHDNGVAYHIAIVLVNDQGVVSLYQCLGSPNRSKTNQGVCMTNLNSDHGVVAKVLNSSIESRNYACIRVVPL